MRVLAYVSVFVIGLVFWTIGMTAMTITAILSVIANKISPGHSRGNCWTFALPLFIEKGGYLLIRRSGGQKFFRVFPVLHVLWVSKFASEGSEFLQFLPTKRKTGSWFPAHTVYYTGKVVTTEKNHDVKS